MKLPVLYSFRRCPYAIRARMAILVSGMVCELREVSLANKPDALLIASPKATIPVMVLPDGRVLDESLDIMGHALEKHDPNGWLVDYNDQAMDLVKINDTTFKYHLDGYKYPQKYQADPLTHAQAGLAILVGLDQKISQGGFLMGDRCSMVDVAIFPFIRQFAAVNEDWFASQPLPNLAKWLAHFLASDAVNAVMINLPVWTPQSDVTRFPFVSPSL